MSKIIKILIIIILVVLIIILYLFLASKNITNHKLDNNYHNATTSIEELEKNYKNNTTKILNNYLMSKQAGNLTLENVQSIKNELLNLKVPAKHKELHLNMVLALDKFKSYLLSGNEKNKESSQDLINQAIADYDWLIINSK